MASRPEEIMTTILSKVTGLSTTGARAFRGRVYPLEIVDLPALTIYMGSDNPLGENGPDTFSFIDSDVDVNISIHVRSNSTQVETELNLIRREIHVALMADTTQGLPYVFMTMPYGTDEPQLSGEGEKRTAVMETNWAVRYRAPYKDIEVT